MKNALKKRVPGALLIVLVIPLLYVINFPKLTAEIPGSNSRNISDYHPFTFDFSNASSAEVFVQSVRVLARDVRMGPGAPNTYRNSSLGTSRKDLTPGVLLETTANFIWWEKQFTHPDSPCRVAIDPSKRMNASLPFPEFDELRHEWECHYTLQPDNTWSGQFVGVTVKPIGIPLGKHNAPTAFPDQPWIHYQFKNESARPIHMRSTDGKLLTGDRETLLFIPTPALDGKYHGFAAHCHKGSIFRPQTGSKIVFTWRFYDGKEEIPQDFELPEFSDDHKNWYCYFIFGKDKKWTAVFEGVSDMKTAQSESEVLNGGRK